MKAFEEYKEGELVIYKNRYNDPTAIYEAYKSKYTPNAFRLKNSTGEVVADISEITPVADGVSYAKSNSNLQSDVRHTIAVPNPLPKGYDSDGFWDSFDIQD